MENSSQFRKIEVKHIKDNHFDILRSQTAGLKLVINPSGLSPSGQAQLL